MSIFDSEVLSFDAATGITHTHHYDTADDRHIVHSEQVITPILEENNRLQKESSGRWNTKGMGLNRVANIPHVLYYKLVRDGIMYNEECLKAWLNDPDNQVFRTRLGKV